MTIKNVSDQPVDPRYRRVMHWNPEPTTFDGYSTIGGTPIPELLATNNCGYAMPDPLSPVPQCGNVPFRRASSATPAHPTSVRCSTSASTRWRPTSP